MAFIHALLVWKVFSPTFAPTHKGKHVSSMTLYLLLSLKEIACILFLSNQCLRIAHAHRVPLAPSRRLAQSRGFNKCLWDA